LGAKISDAGSFKRWNVPSFNIIQHSEMFLMKTHVPWTTGSLNPLFRRTKAGGVFVRIGRGDKTRKILTLRDEESST
jgi:hypothetical protein